MLRRMCRNIRVLHNFAPPTTPEEIRAAALQFVRKVSGTSKPSVATQAAFDRAIAEIAATTEQLLATLRRASRNARARGSASVVACDGLGAQPDDDDAGYQRPSSTAKTVSLVDFVGVKPRTLRARWSSTMQTKRM